MLSIFIMYSPDRKNYLEKQIEHMRRMNSYEYCQKILVLDGKLNVNIQELEVFPLKSEEFTWAEAWETGVNNSKFEKILYLDSDRLLPLDYLEKAYELIKDDRFVYASNLFTICLWPGKEVVDKLLQINPNDVRKELKEIKKGLIIDDTKFGVPLPRHGKNPMSGNTGFTKSTFLESGGVDPWYKGHGAFADSDYFLTMHKKGCEFFDIKEAVELHFGHTKKDKNGNVLKDKELSILSLNNFIYYCKKWGINKSRAISVARDIKIKEPERYVIEKWNDI